MKLFVLQSSRSAGRVVELYKQQNKQNKKRQKEKKKNRRTNTRWENIRHLSCVRLHFMFQQTSLNVLRAILIGKCWKIVCVCVFFLFLSLRERQAEHKLNITRQQENTLPRLHWHAATFQCLDFVYQLRSDTLIHSQLVQHTDKLTVENKRQISHCCLHPWSMVKLKDLTFRLGHKSDYQCTRPHYYWENLHLNLK